MKRSILYIIVCLALVLTGSLPFRGHDVGKLRPVETIAVSGGDIVKLRTDMGDVGSGRSWADALEDLEKTAPGAIFQGTVSYILLEDSGEDLLGTILSQENLNPGCGICLAPEGVDPQKAGEYLRAHEPGENLRSLRGKELYELPRLIESEGRFYLVQP